MRNSGKLDVLNTCQPCHVKIGGHPPHCCWGWWHPRTAIPYPCHGTAAVTRVVWCMSWVRALALVPGMLIMPGCCEVRSRTPWAALEGAHHTHAKLIGHIEEAALA